MCSNVFIMVNFGLIIPLEFLPVFTLSTEKVVGSSVKCDDTSFLLSLSTGPETFSTAQERNLANLRDSMANTNIAHACDIISPAPQLQNLLDQKPDTQQEKNESSTLAAPKVSQKATTAAAFFGKATKDRKPNRSDGDSDNSQTKPVSNAASSAKSKVNSRGKKPAQNVFQRAAVTGKNKAKASTKQDEKENNKQSRKVPIGDADDFVGDMDEEEDEEEEKPAASQKPLLRGRRKPEPTDNDDEVMIEDSGDEIAKDAAKPTIHGAMDDFAKPKEAQLSQDSEGGEKRRRRRKKIVKKAYTDEKGYLHTESQEVWEDVPSDEEEETKKKPAKPVSAPTRPKKKAAKSTDMKQGSLMGFFKKK